MLEETRVCVSIKPKTVCLVEEMELHKSDLRK